MSKYSSYKDFQLMTEGWRNYLSEDTITGEKEAMQWLANQIAPLIAQADAGNFTKPLAALVARLNSAEGMSPLVRALLKTGRLDAQPDDEAINVAMGQEIAAPLLRPTQGVIDLFKSVGYNGSVADSLKKVIAGTSGAPPILAAGSGNVFYIIDGHHRWSGATVFNVKCKIPANIIQMDPGKALLVSQLAIAAYLGGNKPIPSASAKKGRSIIGPDAMSPEQVNGLLLQNVGKVIDKYAGQPFMNRDVLRIIAGTGYGQDEVNELRTGTGKGQKLGKRAERLVRGACTKISQNCGTLAQEYAGEGPPREIMPQFDPKVGGPKFKSVAKGFEDGVLNFQGDFGLNDLAGKRKHIPLKE